jgi:hypothetical protein
MPFPVSKTTGTLAECCARRIVQYAQAQAFSMYFLAPEESITTRPKWLKYPSFKPF